MRVSVRVLCSARIYIDQDNYLFHKLQVWHQIKCCPAFSNKNIWTMRKTASGLSQLTWGQSLENTRQSNRFSQRNTDCFWGGKWILLFCVMLHFLQPVSVSSLNMHSGKEWGAGWLIEKVQTVQLIELIRLGINVIKAKTILCNAWLCYYLVLKIIRLPFSD